MGRLSVHLKDFSPENSFQEKFLVPSLIQKLSTILWLLRNCYLLYCCQFFVINTTLDFPFWCQLHIFIWMQWRNKIFWYWLLPKSTMKNSSSFSFSSFSAIRIGKLSYMSDTWVALYAGWKRSHWDETPWRCRVITHAKNFCFFFLLIICVNVSFTLKTYHKKQFLKRFNNAISGNSKEK